MLRDKIEVADKDAVGVNIKICVIVKVIISKHCDYEASSQLPVLLYKTYTFKTGHYKTGHYKTGHYKTGHYKTGNQQMWLQFTRKEADKNLETTDQLVLLL